MSRATQYGEVTEQVIELLSQAVEEVYTDEETRSVYASDETGLYFPPDVVVKPRSKQEILEIVRIANEFKIPITPRGGGTGLSGGALPVYGGILLSTEKLNSIIDVDTVSGLVITEPAVITQVLQEEVAKLGLYYPPDPASRGSCFIGGNISEDSAGPHAFKYGTTRAYVLNLEVVTPTGETFWTGSDTTKNTTGYNLTQALVGSEGTLAIITKATLKLIAHPEDSLLLVLPFDSIEKATNAVGKIMQSGIMPAAIEFMEQDALNAAKSYLQDVSVSLPDATAMLWVELDGFTDTLFTQAEKISNLLSKDVYGDILFAHSDADKERLWQLRRVIGLAVKSISPYVDADTIVPRRNLPELLKRVKQLEKIHGLKTICYGHAGDGNIHVNILKGDLDDQEWKNRLERMLDDITRTCVELSGTLAGEHGTGLIHRNRLPLAVPESEITLMKQIKKLWDPLNILNPGKIFP
ncbi:MAG: FAD-binding protein [Chlorobi bacterium]|nr:FAD-binding protein [Chlorobiota bacterium]